MASAPLPPDLAWPADSPRVRLVQVLGLESRSGALASLVGSRDGGQRFKRPYGVAWLGDDLLVADPGARRVFRLAADGSARGSGELGLESPVGLAVCEAGVVVTDSSRGAVALLDRDLRLRAWLAEGLDRPTGVACGASEVYVAETGAHRIRVLAAGGGTRFLGGRGPQAGQFNFPTVLALHDGALFVGDTLNFRVQRLDRQTGEVLQSFGRLGDSPGEMPRMKGLAVDSEGRVWISDALTNSVSLYAAQGDLLLSLGGLGDAPGRFNFPAGVAAGPRGRVAVADSFNGRVQVYGPVP